MTAIGVWYVTAVIAIGVSVATLRRWFDPVIGGLAATISWAVFAFMATDLERVTDCCVTSFSNTPAALLGGGFAAVMFLFTIRPALVSLNPNRSVDREPD